MNEKIYSESQFYYKTYHLTSQSDDVLPIPFLSHTFSDDLMLKIFFIVFPKVINDPHVDEKFQRNEAD